MQKGKEYFSKTENLIELLKPYNTRGDYTHANKLEISQ